MRVSLCFLFFFMVNAVFSQKNAALTNKEYLELQSKVRASTNSNVDSAFIYADRMEKSGNNLHKAFAVGAKSYLYQIKGDSIRSKVFYKKAFDFLNKIPPGNEKTKVNAYLLNYGGLSDWKRYNFSNALMKYQQGRKLSQKVGDLIQVIKFNGNISAIYGDIGNYRLAINTAKESDRLTEKNAYLYDKRKYNQSKTAISYKLGSFYEKEYFVRENNPFLLDSAAYFYKQVLLYSTDVETNNINAKINLGNIYKHRNNFKEAEHIYLGLLKSSKNNLTIDNFKYLNVNLGELYFNQKKYNEALVCFKKIDSAHVINNNSNVVFNYSNYYQSKIYNILNDNEKALLHSRIYLDNYKKEESKISKEAIDINFKIGEEAFSKEMLEIEQKNKKKVLRTQIFQGSTILLFVLLIVFLIWNINQKKKANLKAMQLIEEFKMEIEKNKLKSQDEVVIPQYQPAEIVVKNDILSVNIDEEKENEIVRKLKELEDKLVFLNQDFTQQYVAKRIKTNTTYLSYVVNKRFGKSFSEYANELKINYVINQLITNPTYRKYSTQAIAESVGFKKANSFTISFKKRTGITPVQFAEKIGSNYTV